MNLDPQDPYVLSVRAEIARWEGETPGVVARAGEVVLSPALGAIAKIVPSRLQEGIARAIEGALQGLGGQARRFVDLVDIARRIEATKAEHPHPLEAADTVATHFKRQAIALAAGSGAATGLAGVAGIAADVPAVLGVAMRLVAQIAACYGFDPHDELERDYLLAVLRLGSTAEAESRREVLASLEQVDHVLLEVAWKKLSASIAKGRVAKATALLGAERLAALLGVQLSRRKVAQIVPVVGAVAGGVFNAMFLDDVAKAAMNAYRRRWIAAHLYCGPLPALVIETELDEEA